MEEMQRARCVGKDAGFHDISSSLTQKLSEAGLCLWGFYRHFLT